MACSWIWSVTLKSLLNSCRWIQDWKLSLGGWHLLSQWLFHWKHTYWWLTGSARPQTDNLNLARSENQEKAPQVQRTSTRIVRSRLCSFLYMMSFADKHLGWLEMKDMHRCTTRCQIQDNLDPQRIVAQAESHTANSDCEFGSIQPGLDADL